MLTKILASLCLLLFVGSAHAWETKWPEAYGEAYAEDAAIEVTVSEAETAYEIASGLSSGVLKRVTFGDSHNLTVAMAGYYMCFYTVCMDTNGTDEIETAVMIDGVAQGKGTGHTTISAAAKAVELAGMLFASLTVGQEVSLAVRNISSTNNITVEHVNLIIFRIGGL